jgi:hypothetical protein
LLDEEERVVNAQDDLLVPVAQCPAVVKAVKIVPPPAQPPPQRLKFRVSVNSANCIFEFDSDKIHSHPIYTTKL